MWVIILWFIFLVCLLTVLVHYSTVLGSNVALQKVTRTHTIAATILDTKVPPKQWMEEPTHNTMLTRMALHNMVGVVRWEKRTQRKCLRELRRLIKYFQTSSLVEDEETRAVLLEELEKIYKSWRDDWKDVERIVFGRRDMLKEA